MVKVVIFAGPHSGKEINDLHKKIQKKILDDGSAKIYGDGAISISKAVDDGISEIEDETDDEVVFIYWGHGKPNNIHEIDKTKTLDLIEDTAKLLGHKTHVALFSCYGGKNITAGKVNNQYIGDFFVEASSVEVSVVDHNIDDIANLTNQICSGISRKAAFKSLAEAHGESIYFLPADRKDALDYARISRPGLFEREEIISILQKAFPKNPETVQELRERLIANYMDVAQPRRHNITRKKIALLVDLGKYPEFKKALDIFGKEKEKEENVTAYIKTRAGKVFDEKKEGKKVEKEPTSPPEKKKEEKEEQKTQKGFTDRLRDLFRSSPTTVSSSSSTKPLASAASTDDDKKKDQVDIKKTKKVLEKRDNLPEIIAWIKKGNHVDKPMIDTSSELPPLFQLINKNHIEGVTTLITDYNASTKIRSYITKDLNLNAIEFAAYLGHFEIALYLIDEARKRGEKTNIGKLRTKDSKSFIHQAIRHFISTGQDEKLDLLITNGTAVSTIINEAIKQDQKKITQKYKPTAKFSFDDLIFSVKHHENDFLLDLFQDQSWIDKVFHQNSPYEPQFVQAAISSNNSDFLTILRKQGIIICNPSKIEIYNPKKMNLEMLIELGKHGFDLQPICDNIPDNKQISSLDKINNADKRKQLTSIIDTSWQIHTISRIKGPNDLENIIKLSTANPHALCYANNIDFGSMKSKNLPKGRSVLARILIHIDPKTAKGQKELGLLDKELDLFLDNTIFTLSDYKGRNLIGVILERAYEHAEFIPLARRFAEKIVAMTSMEYLLKNLEQFSPPKPLLTSAATHQKNVQKFSAQIAENLTTDQKEKKKEGKGSPSKSVKAGKATAASSSLHATDHSRS